MTPTWDLFIIVFFALSIVFGIALGRQRAVVGVIASYIGLVTANVGGNALYNILGGTSANVGSIALNAGSSPFLFKVIIFGLIAILLIVKGDFLKTALTHHTGAFSMLAAGIYSFLNAGLIITALVSFLSDSQRTDILAQSSLANTIVQYQILWLVVPVLLMIVLGFKHREDKG